MQTIILLMKNKADKMGKLKRMDEIQQILRTYLELGNYKAAARRLRISFMLLIIKIQLLQNLLITYENLE